MNIFPDWIGSTSFSSLQKGAIIEIEKGWQLLSIPIKSITNICTITAITKNRLVIFKKVSGVLKLANT